MTPDEGILFFTLFFPRAKNDFEEANQRVCEETDGTKNYNEGIRRTRVRKS